MAKMVKQNGIALGSLGWNRKQCVFSVCVFCLLGVSYLFFFC